MQPPGWSAIFPQTVLLVAHADVASLWSAARMQQYLGEAGGREQVRLVLNRFRKIAGFQRIRRGSRRRREAAVENSQSVFRGVHGH